MRKSIIATAILCAVGLAGCLGISAGGSTPPPAADPNWMSEVERLMDQGRPMEAVEILRRQPENADTFYRTGCAYALAGDFDQADMFYHKALAEDPGHQPTHQALSDISHTRLVHLHTRIDEAGKRKARIMELGEGDLAAIMEEIDLLRRQQARIYLSQSETYLLYENIESNVADYPSLDAHLRDIQAVFEEKNADSIAQQELDSTAEAIRTARSRITKKYARTLYEKGVQLASQGKTTRAVDALKEADDHTSRFFEDERPTGKASYLVQDEEITDLARKIVSTLLEDYRKLLDITAVNRDLFVRTGRAGDAEEQTHKMEELLQSSIQLRIHSLWRFERMARKKAEEHEDLVPLYSKFIEYFPESSKAGEYHYRLARHYFEKDRARSREHALRARELMGGYEIDRMLETLGEPK